MIWDNSKTNAGVTVAAFCLEKASKNTYAGLVVQPVVWAVQGTGPDAGDAFIYGATAIGAAAGAILAVPATITGIVKAYVDDYVGGLVNDAKKDEPEAVRGGIAGVDDYSFTASNNHITAMTVASFGGVAWQHPNGAYLFIRDAEGYPICDYQPQKYKRLYKPVLPVRKNGNRVIWRYEGV